MASISLVTHCCQFIIIPFDVISITDAFVKSSLTKRDIYPYECKAKKKAIPVTGRGVL
jgi:hypothetical protein